MMKVLCLGAIAMDAVIETNALPEDDGFSLVESENLVPGGSCSNVSVALRKMGVSVYQAGKIGDDRFGREFKADLENNGVDTRYLAVKPGGTTLHTYILTAPGGKHCIFANKGDCVMNLEAEDLPENVLDGVCCFYTDMFSPRSSICLAEEAVSRGIPVVYNMQCAPGFMSLFGVSGQEIDKMLSLCDLFISGREGYLEMTGEKDLPAAMGKLYGRYGCSDGVIGSAGSRGACWLYHGRMMEHKAFAIDAIDTTGAGDCFSAGIVFDHYYRGNSSEKSLLFASALAALKCTVRGPRSRADLSMVEDFIDSHNIERKE